MFEKDKHYVLAVESFDGKQREDKIYCVWNGMDFYPLKALFIVDPYIPAREPINNRVRILSVRRMC